MSVFIDVDTFPCECFDGAAIGNHKESDLEKCDNPLSLGFQSPCPAVGESDIQSLTYHIFDLIEPAIKAAIAQALQEHLEQSE